MSRYIVGKISLSGNDAVALANSLFKPTHELIEKNRQIWSDIDENVKIKRTNDGFEADIDYLDLSFLNGVPDEKKLNIEITLHIKPHEPVYNNSKKENLQTTVAEKNNNKYSAPENSEFLVWAA